jgi:hypothetical protein
LYGWREKFWGRRRLLMISLQWHDAKERGRPTHPICDLFPPTSSPGATFFPPADCSEIDTVLRGGRGQVDRAETTLLADGREGELRGWKGASRCRTVQGASMIYVTRLPLMRSGPS